MEARDFIESGKLELYVYGVLNDEEAAEVRQMARDHEEVRDEVERIEKAIISLSSGFSPYLSAERFAIIRDNLKLSRRSRRGSSPVWAFLGWTAALVFLAAAVYFYLTLNENAMQAANIRTETEKLKDSIITTEASKRRTEFALGVLRDYDNHIVTLGGQKAAPEAMAKLYWNMDTKAVFVDAAGLPEPPEGQVYQVWALRFRPLRPMSIGMLDDFRKNPDKIFSVENATSAQAFGITLEPEGGSQTPTMDQLYVIGKAF